LSDVGDPDHLDRTDDLEDRAGVDPVQRDQRAAAAADRLARHVEEAPAECRRHADPAVVGRRPPETH
jgi:hypothetical protein